MDPLSLAASIAGLAGLVATVVSTTYQYGSGVIGAAASQKSLLGELQSLRSTLQRLDIVVAEKDASSAKFFSVSEDLGTAIMECQDVINELYDKLRKKLDAGKLKGAMHRLTWPLAEADTLKKTEMLARYRGLFHLALGVDTWYLCASLLCSVSC